MSGQGGRWYEGSMTVEAAMVMGLTLLIIGALLEGLFAFHCRVAEHMILSEAVERNLAFDEEWAGENHVKRSAVAEDARRRLSGCFRCGHAALTLKGDRLRGWYGAVSDQTTGEMHVPGYRPEQALRLLTVIKEVGTGHDRPEGGTVSAESQSQLHDSAGN